MLEKNQEAIQKQHLLQYEIAQMFIAYYSFSFVVQRTDNRNPPHVSLATDVTRRNLMAAKLADVRK